MDPWQHHPVNQDAEILAELLETYLGKMGGATLYQTNRVGGIKNHCHGYCVKLKNSTQTRAEMDSEFTIRIS